VTIHLSMQVQPQGFDVVNQGGRRVPGQAGQIILDQGRASPTAALVKANRPEPLGIMPLAVAAGAGRRSRPAMKPQHRNPGRIP
jgi:hypothetical protein